MNQKRLILLVFILVAVVWAAYELRTPKPSPAQAPPEAVQPPQPTKIEIAASEDRQRQQDAEACLAEAQRRLREAETEEPEQRDAHELEASWLEYLQRIQAQGNYPNWSGPPCDQYLHSHAGTVQRAVDLGLVTMDVHGNGLKSVTLTVTSTENHPILNQTLVVPAGTVFVSSSGNAQSMMAAATVRFAFYPASNDSDDQHALLRRGRKSVPTGLRLASARGRHRARGGILRASYLGTLPEQSITQEVPSYCINRWLNIPTEETQFTVSQLEGNNPLRMLVDCVDPDPSKHDVNQRAIWIVSDHLYDLTREQLAEKFVAELESHAYKTPAELADAIKRRSPDVPNDEIAQIESMSTEEFEQVQTKYIKAVASAEVDQYLTTTRPLLEDCGIDVLKTKLFQSEQ